MQLSPVSLSASDALQDQNIFSSVTSRLSAPRNRIFSNPQERTVTVAPREMVGHASESDLRNFVNGLPRGALTHSNVMQNTTDEPAVYIVGRDLHGGDTRYISPRFGSLAEAAVHAPLLQGTALNFVSKSRHDYSTDVTLVPPQQELNSSRMKVLRERGKGELKARHKKLKEIAFTRYEPRVPQYPISEIAEANARAQALQDEPLPVYSGPSGEASSSTATHFDAYETNQNTGGSSSYPAYYQGQ